MISFPWDSIVQYMEDGYPVYDRAYTAQQWRDIYATFFSNGIFSDSKDMFTVTANQGMTVTVDPGRCNINGTFGVEYNKRELQLVAATSNPRIDTVVLRWDSSVEGRKIDLYVKEGVSSVNPVRQNLTREGTIYELGLCDIYIPANTTEVRQDRITDTRLDNNRCGIVSPLIKVDTTNFFKQIQAAVDKAVEEMNKAMDGTTVSRIEGKLDSINDFTTGINLIQGSKDFRLGANAYDANYNTDGFKESSNVSFYKDEEGYKVARIGTASTARALSFPLLDVGEDGELTLSFDVYIEKSMASSAQIIQLAIYEFSEKKYALNKAITLADLGLSDATPGEWHKAIYRFSWKSAVENSKFATYFKGNTSNYIDVRKIKVEVGNIHNPIWSESPFDVNDYTTGVNLLRGTRDFTEGTVSAGVYEGTLKKDGWVITPSYCRVEKDDEGFGILDVFDTSSAHVVSGTALMAEQVGGETVTVSFEVMFTERPSENSNLFQIIPHAKKTSESQPGLYAMLSDNIYGYTYSNIPLNKWIKVVKRFYLEYREDYYFRIGFYNNSGVAPRKFRKCKLELGAINNPIWSPSPFDIGSIELGGTGGKNGLEARENLGIFNRHAGTIGMGMQNDTRAFWAERESGVYLVETSNQVHGQPSQYGLIIHYAYDYEIQQIWLTNGAGGGRPFFRRANYSTTTMPDFSPLPVESGGTGLTSNPSMLTDLGSESAGSVFTKEPRPGITGTLGVGHGGTGAKTAEVARTNLGAASTAVATTSANGLMSSSDKAKLNRNPIVTENYTSAKFSCVAGSNTLVETSIDTKENYAIIGLCQIKCSDSRLSVHGFGINSSPTGAWIRFGNPLSTINVSDATVTFKVIYARTS